MANAPKLATGHDVCLQAFRCGNCNHPTPRELARALREAELTYAMQIACELPMRFLIIQDQSFNLEALRGRGVARLSRGEQPA